MNSNSEISDGVLASLTRAMGLLRQLAEAPPEGLRITDLAAASGLSPATTHRLLKALAAERLVEQPSGSKRYRLALELFMLAARAGLANGLRDLARPALLRLSATLTDTIFLLVRNGFDAVCLDRVEGPFPIRSFTGDIGGKVPLGLGQGSLAILAFQTEAEREAIIRYNVPRLLDRGPLDEVGLRTEIDKVRSTGAAYLNSGLIAGMAGVGVAILDWQGRAVAALSVGTLADRLNPDRLPTVIKLLRAEAAAISAQLNPFDPTVRQPARSLAG